MAHWILSHETALGWLAAVSVFAFVATLIVVPVLVVRIPADYFTRGSRFGKAPGERHAVLRGIGGGAKSLLGCILIAVGIMMLVLPGQGMLTIAVGVMLLNSPGKYKLEGGVVSRPPVLRSINWIRRRAGREPLVTPPA
jgi:hypothetical protein